MPKSKSSTKQPQTKTQFVLAQDPKLSAVEIVKLGKAAGLIFSPQLVHNVRWTAKRKGPSSKSSSAASASKSKKAASARPATAKPAAHVAPSAVKSAAGIAGISALDLAYAVGRLVAAGKTSVAEVSGLARERVARITTLETQLAALKHGAVPAGEATRTAASSKRPSKPAPAKKKSAKPSAPKSVATAAKPAAAKPAAAKSGVTKPAAAKPAATAAKPAAPAAKPATTTSTVAKPAASPAAAKPAPAKPAVAKPAAKAPAAKPSKPAKAGHAFTMTPKALAARQTQAQYMGALRVMPESEKSKYKALAKEKGVATALAEIKKRATK